LVKTYGRSPGERVRRNRPTTSSEWPRPYTAAVSIQFTPCSIACPIAAIDAESSCGPQPKDQPPPPAAHAPNPTVVSVRPLVPRGLVGRVMKGMISRLALRQPFAYYAPHLGGDRMTARPLFAMIFLGTAVSAQTPAQPAAA